MKKLLLNAFIVLFSIGLFAQSPELINYQAIARDGAGTLLSNQSLDVRIGIYSGIGASTLMYEETHTVTANQYGMFSLKIGSGTVGSGTFSAISWGTDEHHLKVEVDAGSGYVDLGTNQLVTVPYAMHATSAEKASNLSINELNDVNATMPMAGQMLGWNGSNWTALNDSTGPWHLNGSDVYYDMGNVGIGTNTPDQKLSVHSTSGISYVRVSDATSGTTSGLRMGMSGSGNAYIINDATSKSLSLGTEGTTRLRITSQGYMGLNVTSPGQLFHLKQTGANRGIRIEHQSSTDYWGIGIGTTTKNFKFYYNNLFRADIASLDGSYTQSSDRRLKTDIKDMDNVLTKVNKLKPSTYFYKDSKDVGTRSIGFIAQDVDEVFPDLVREMGDGYKGVVYDGFAVISIKAIQELYQKVEEMQKEIDKLKSANQ